MCEMRKERERERGIDYKNKRQKVRRDHREIMEKETQGRDLNREWREWEKMYMYNVLCLREAMLRNLVTYWDLLLGDGCWTD